MPGGVLEEDSFLLSVGRQRLGLTVGCILDNSILENSQEVGFTKHIDFEQDREKQTLFMKSPFYFLEKSCFVHYKFRNFQESSKNV